MWEGLSNGNFSYTQINLDTNLINKILFEESGTGIIIIDIKGIYLFVNSKAAKNLGDKANNIIGKSIFDFMPKEKAEQYFARNYQFIIEGKSVTYEDTFLLESGEYTFIIKDTVLKDSSGKGYAIQSTSIDITEKKKTDKELEYSRKKYQLLYENTSKPFLLSTLDGRIEETNLATSKIFGQEKEDILKYGCKLIIDNADLRYQIALNILKETGHFFGELTGLKKDGSKFPIEITASLFKDIDGTLKSSTIIKDISERKLAEDLLKESEARIRSIIESMDAIIFLIEKDGKLIECNESFAKRFNTTKEKIIGTNLFDLLPGEEAKEGRAIVNNVITNGISYRTEKFKDGYWNDYSVVPICTDGKILDRVAIISRDVTELIRTEELLKESEANARAIMESTDEVFMLIDKKGILLDCNDAHAKRLNSTRKELIGQNIFNLLPSDIGERRNQLVDEVIATKKPFFGEDYRDGFWNEFIVHPVIAEGKEINKVAVFSKDITERKINVEILKENEKRLKEINSTKDKLFSIIAHDLKSPFNTILGFSELIIDEIKNNDLEKVNLYAGLIRDSSERTLTLVENLLDWSRTQTGKIAIKLKNTELKSIVDNCIQLLSDRAFQKSITLANKIPEQLFALVDHDMFNVIIRNLISNAIKFTNKGGNITVSSKEDENQIRIIVEDSGIGIEASRLNGLFQLGENHSTIGTKKESGTGLGLIVCKEFVEELGGTIWAESEVGQGSKFCFTVPLNK